MSNFLVGRNLADPSYDVFSGTGAQTAFTLTTQSSTAAATVTISGVTQRPSTDFTISGTTLTFTTAPASGTNNVLVQYNKAYVVGTPGDATVTTAKLADDAVTTAKIGDDAVTLAKMAAGTAGNLITYDASGNPAAVATGTAAQLLTSGGAGVAPTFQDPPTSGPTLATAQTAGGTALTFSGIPSGTKRIDIGFSQVSGAGSTSPWFFTIGDAGGLETTGYTSQGWGYDTTPTLQESFITTAFTMGGGSFPNSAYNMNGLATFLLIDASTNTWVFWGTVARDVSTVDNAFGTGNKSLSGELTQLQFSKTSNFDNGKVSIQYA